MQRDWQTTEGPVALMVQYQVGAPDCIHISVTVPKTSQLRLPSIEQTATQNHPGQCHLSIPAPNPNEVYPLEVQFNDGLAADPLTFAIQCRNLS